MNNDLATGLKSLGISAAEFAKLARVTVRAVNMWLTNERGLPGPARAYLDLLAALPRALQKKELARIRDEDSSMFEGMYGIQFAGREGFGTGVLVLMGGKVFGLDEGRVEYDGRYEPSPTTPNHLEVALRVTVPPGLTLVTGVQPQPVTYWFDLQTSFPARERTTSKVETPFGPVGVRIEYLRGLPQQLVG
jgi:hypothetical protein